MIVRYLPGMVMGIESKKREREREKRKVGERLASEKSEKASNEGRDANGRR